MVRILVSLLVAASVVAVRGAQDPPQGSRSRRPFAVAAISFAPS